MQYTKKSVFVFLFVLSSYTASASEPLTEKNISQFISSFSELKPLAQEKQLEMKRQRAATSQSYTIPKRPFSEAIPQMRAEGLYDEATRVVRRHGFSTFEAWANVGDRVMRAYMASLMQGQQQVMPGQVEQFQKMIADNPNMTPEQKKMALDSMKQMQQIKRQLDDVDPADIELVRHHRNRIEAAMGARPEGG